MGRGESHGRVSLPAQEEMELEHRASPGGRTQHRPGEGTMLGLCKSVRQQSCTEPRRGMNESSEQPRAVGRQGGVEARGARLEGDRAGVVQGET